MTTREKIIVAMAGAALLYGTYNTLSEPDVPDVVKKEAVSSTIVTANEVLKNEPVDAEAIYRVLDNAQLPWRDKAFLAAGIGIEFGKDRDQASMREVPAAAQKFIYSGFLEMNGERIAIINDVEYRAGDMVNDFVVDNISPEQIRMSKDGKSFELVIRERK